MYNRSTYELAEFAEESISAFIMALSVLNSIYLSSSQEGIANVNVMVYSVFGACMAWGLIDGVVQYVGIEVRRARFRRLSKSLRGSMSLSQFTEHLQHNIDENIIHHWGQDAVAQLFEKKNQIESSGKTAARAKDFFAFACVILVYLLAATIVAAPLLLMNDLYSSVIASNIISTVSLFLIGYGWGKSIEHQKPMVLGLITALIGFLLLIACVALGG